MNDLVHMGSPVCYVDANGVGHDALVVEVVRVRSLPWDPPRCTLLWVGHGPIVGLVQFVPLVPHRTHRNDGHYWCTVGEFASDVTVKMGKPP